MHASTIGLSGPGRLKAAAFFAGISLLCCAPWAHAYDAFFDTTFATTGRELLNISTSGDQEGLVVREMPDGRLLVLGECGSTVCLARLRPDGSFDPSYGPDGLGYARFDQFGGLPNGIYASDMILLSDGRAAIAASVGYATTFVYVVRADGTALDASMGNGTGYLDHVFGSLSPYSCGCRILQQPDGKFIVSETATKPGIGAVMAVARLTQNLGGLDTGFGTQGVQTVVFGLQGPSANTDNANALALQPDGKIVLAGNGIATGGAYSIEFSRLLADGQRDTTFGDNNDGRFHYVDPAVASAFINDIGIDSAQRIVFGGHRLHSGATSLLVGRLTSAGVLDTTFSGGYLSFTANAPGTQDITSIAVTPDSILALSLVPRSSNSTASYFNVTRLNLDGTLAPQFGFSGNYYASFDAASSADSAGALTLTRRGIVLTGSSQVSNGSRIGIARLQYEHIFSGTFE